MHCAKESEMHAQLFATYIMQYSVGINILLRYLKYLGYGVDDWPKPSRYKIYCSMPSLQGLY